MPSAPDVVPQDAGIIVPHEAGIVGMVLAAGAGVRFGGPKALAVSRDGSSWLITAVRTLLAGGCSPVLVVLGAGAKSAETLLERAFPTVSLATQAGPVRRVLAEDWSAGMASSIRAGLIAADKSAPPPIAVAIVTVDVPSLDASMVRRMTTPGPSSGPLGPRTLRQASFEGRPGHPVVIGRAHWAALSETLHGDVGAKPYLRTHAAEVIDCSDLGSGLDTDTVSDHDSGLDSDHDSDSDSDSSTS